MPSLSAGAQADLLGGGRITFVLYRWVDRIEVTPLRPTSGTGCSPLTCMRRCRPGCGTSAGRGGQPGLKINYHNNSKLLIY